MVVGLRVEAENIRTGVTKHCNSSYFTMVAKDGSGISMNVPGLILDTEESIRRFARSMERQKQLKIREKTFQPSVFQVEKYYDKLKEFNVNITFEQED